MNALDCRRSRAHFQFNIVELWGDAQANRGVRTSILDGTTRTTSMWLIRSLLSVNWAQEDHITKIHNNPNLRAVLFITLPSGPSHCLFAQSGQCLSHACSDLCKSTQVCPHRLNTILQKKYMPEESVWGIIFGHVMEYMT